MKFNHLYLVFAFFVFQPRFASGQDMPAQQLGYLENKGQIIDQHGKANKDVLYLLPGNRANLQLRKTGFSYDLYSIENFQLPEDPRNEWLGERFLPTDSNVYHYHRIDVEWIGCNKNIEVVAEGKSADYRNYYTSGTPEGGVKDIRHFKRVLYKNVWPLIDVEFLSTANGPKYNYIVHAGGDIAAIQWKYKGANSESLQDGNIVLETSQGAFNESIPLSYTLESGDTVNMRYRLEKGKYNFSGNSPSEQTVIIDPVPSLIWSSWFGYGGQNNIWGTFMRNHLFYYGHTDNATNVATTGSYQTSINGLKDGVIYKYTKSRNLVWATYFGGIGDDFITLCKEYDGKLFFIGHTKSYNFPATSGKYQSTLGGAQDGFVFQMNSNGGLIWSSFIGGSVDDYVSDITFVHNQIYLVGSTDSYNQIATIGSFKPTKIYYGSSNDEDGFVMKLDTGMTTKVWGTYLGGNSRSTLWNAIVDNDTNVVVAGHTYATNMATPNAYLTVNPAINQLAALTMKFTPSGSLLWSTYFGDSDSRFATVYKSTDSKTLLLTKWKSSSVNPTNCSTPWNSTHYAVLHEIDSNGYPDEILRFPNSQFDIFSLVIEDNDFWFYGSTPYAYSGLYGVHLPSKQTPALSYDGLLVKFTNAQLSWITYVEGNSINGYIFSCSVQNDSILLVVSSEPNFTTTDSVLGNSMNQNSWGRASMLFRDTCNNLSLANYGNIYGLAQVCPYDTVNYNINPQLFTEHYTWSVPTGAQIVSGQGTACMRVVFATTSGNITVTPRNACDTAATISLAVNVSQPPSQPHISPTLDTLYLCPNDTLVLSADVNQNILWSNGDSTTTTFIFTAGTYVLTHLDTSNCASDAMDSVWVNWYATPDTPSVSPNGLLRICVGDSIQLSAPSSDQYLWSTGNTTQTIWINQAGQYSLQIKDSVQCWSFTSTQVQIVIDSALAKPGISPSGPLSICPGDSVLLSSQNTNVPLWSTGSTSSAIYAKTAGVYFVSAVDTNSACPATVSDTVWVSVVPLFAPPSITVLGNDTLCQGDSVQLSSNQILNNIWNTGDTTQSIWVSQSGSYFAFQQNALQCNSDTSNILSIVVQTPPQKPSIVTNGATTFCQGDSVLLTITSSVPILWSSGDITNSIWVKSTGSYFVQTNGQSACPPVFSDTIAVLVLAVPATPAILFLGDSVLCSNNSVTLQSNFPNQNRWSTGDTTQSIVVNSANTIKLWRASQNGCFSDTVTFEVKQGAVDLGPDREMCAGERIQLSAQGSGSYVWNTGETGNNISISPTASTAFWAMDQTSGCADAVYITVRPKPVAQFNVTPTQGFTPLTVQTANTSTGATSYTWYFGDGDSSSLTNPTHVYEDFGAYVIQLIVSNQWGCTDTAISISIDAIASNNFWIPNSFTPNNDGINDLFEMHGIPKPYSFSVFNRWGDKVYSSSDYINDWDGTYNGTVLPIGAYTYIIEYKYFNPNSTDPNPKGSPRTIQGVLFVH